MAVIKSMDKIAAKWSSVTAGRGGDYAAGVKAPRKSWSQGAQDAEEAYVAGVTAAASAGRFGKGVAAAGDGKWQRKASTVGAQRFGPGVQAAKGDYQAGFAPYASVIAATDLPPRGAKGDPRNYERSSVIGQALHEAKVNNG